MNRPLGAAPATPVSIEQVRDALAHLHDPGSLQTHPLAALADGTRVANRGRALQQALLDAVDALKPAPGARAGSKAVRRYRLLMRRYVDGLAAEAVQGELAVGRSEYYREHQRALEAVVSLLAERLGAGVSAVAGAPTRLPGAEAPGNLPVYLTSFVGREKEVAAVTDLLGAARLVTLTGPPGTGKTRLAGQVAERAHPALPDGAVFVALAPLKDPDLVVPTIAQALGVRESPSSPLFDRLVDHMRPRTLLLVLDNFEQLAPGAPRVGELLAACPCLRVLVTSRVPLRLDGEHLVAVPPLAVPDPGHPLALEELPRYAAVRLFVERARAAASDFALTAESAPAVAAICRRLDGLPLAIELAAARVKVLPPRAMLARLDAALGGLALLTGGPVDRPARQRTLRGAIEWSHTLLSEPEQVLFRRLAVFVGGCTLATAAAVCAADGDQGADVLEGVEGLVAHSLLRREEAADGEPHFVMLELVREYALELLVESGELAEMRRRHAAAFLAYVEGTDTGVHGRLWLEESHNLRAALGWAIESGDAETALRLVTVLSHAWYIAGPRSEARAWVASALALPAGPELASVRVRPLLGASALAWSQEDYAAGQAYGMEVVELARAHGTPEELSLALTYLGIALAAQGDLAGARPHLEAACALVQVVGHSQLTLGDLCRLEGDFSTARELYERCLANERARGDRGRMSLCQRDLGYALQHLGHDREAVALFTESLTVCHAEENRLGTAEALVGFALAALSAGHPTRAAVLCGAIEAQLEALGGVLPFGDRGEYEPTVAAARAALGDAAFDEAWARGRSMTPELAVSYALSDASGEGVADPHAGPPRPSAP